MVLHMLANMGGYLIGDLKRKAPGPTHVANTQISTGHHSDTVTLRVRCVRVMLVRNLGFPGLRRFRECRSAAARNSYRSLLWHLYELVKLNSYWT
jgi:hypothetical protein